MSLTFAQHTQADELTAELTALGTWANFCDSMRGGYVPTIRMNTGRLSASKLEENQNIAILRHFVLACGFKFYDGSKVISELV